MGKVFQWKKRGSIFCPQNKYEWMYSHAQLPVPIKFSDFIRVYFSTREKYDNGMSRAYGAFIDLDRRNFSNILRISSKPIMNFGDAGEFDEFGIMPDSIVKQEDEYYLYYTGWTRMVGVPYNWAIGLAKSIDGENFEKLYRGPLITSSMGEPYLHAKSIVYRLSEKNWHMFYLSGTNWLIHDGRHESQYVIKHATSNDGVNWIRDNRPILDAVVDNECQTSPTIIKVDDKYHMFFCYRYGLDFRNNKEKSYRIGYAFSYDFINWNRDDSKVGIDVSEYGWDSDMMCYPNIIEVDGKYYLFYNGNGFGQSGFGYAELVMK